MNFIENGSCVGNRDGHTGRSDPFRYGTHWPIYKRTGLVWSMKLTCLKVKFICLCLPYGLRAKRAGCELKTK